MYSKSDKIVIIEGCDFDFIEYFIPNESLRARGAILTHTDELERIATLYSGQKARDILDYINNPARDDEGPHTIPYCGYVLLRS